MYTSEGSMYPSSMAGIVCNLLIASRQDNGGTFFLFVKLSQNSPLVSSWVRLISNFSLFKDVLDTTSLTSEDECKWQLAPNDLFS
jgi:hypothetical protein